jgi:hypothetical protein
VSTPGKVVGAAQKANMRLARRMDKVIKSTGTDTRRGMCQKAIREAIQQEYGSDFDKYHKGNARDSMNAWRQSPYAVDPSRGSMPGDILYKAPTRAVPLGHVGIRVAGNKVGENSSTTRGRVRGAYGYRSLEDFGTVALIVRLPEAGK